MARDSTESIKQWLGKLKPLAPIKTGFKDALKPITGIRAVLFDIYGTLLISASGDVASTRFSESETAACIDRADIRPGRGKELGARIIELYVRKIKESHAASRSRGIRWPEVDIMDIWQGVVAELKGEGILLAQAAPDLAALAYAFEVLNNPVYPMPGLKRVLELLSRRGMRLGIVSNAQFFTPVILNYFLGGEVPQREPPLSLLPPFEPPITIFSYRYGRAKPDPCLFEYALAGLSDLGIRSEEAVFIGNDMLKDIYAASTRGLKTILFAGDARSLKLRQDEPGVGSCRPDAAVTELEMIPGLLV